MHVRYPISGAAGARWSCCVAALGAALPLGAVGVGAVSAAAPSADLRPRHVGDSARTSSRSRSCRRVGYAKRCSGARTAASASVTLVAGRREGGQDRVHRQRRHGRRHAERDVRLDRRSPVRHHPRRRAGTRGRSRSARRSRRRTRGSRARRPSRSIRSRSTSRRPRTRTSRASGWTSPARSPSSTASPAACDNRAHRSPATVKLTLVTRRRARSSAARSR